MPAGPRLAATEAVLRICFFLRRKAVEEMNGLGQIARTPVVTDVAGDHDSKNQESTAGDFGAPHCSCVFSYSK
jgi:hypothetical protein